jgi:hypothetical protein
MFVRLEGVTAAITRQRSDPFVQARVVLHGARPKRVEPGIQVNVPLADLGVVTHKLRLGNLREAGRLSAKEVGWD